MREASAFVKSVRLIKNAFGELAWPDQEKIRIEKGRFETTFLELKLLQVFEHTESKILFIRGVFSSEEISLKNPNINARNNKPQYASSPKDLKNPFPRREAPNNISERL